MRTKKVTKKCKRCPAIMVDVDVNRKYCNHCSNEMNAERNKKRDSHKAWERRKAKRIYFCPMCGKRKSTEKYCRCKDCQAKVVQFDIVDLLSLEHRLIA